MNFRNGITNREGFCTHTTGRALLEEPDMEDDGRKPNSAHEQKSPKEIEAALEELKTLVHRIEIDDMSADLVAVLLNHMPADPLDDQARDKFDKDLRTKLDWDKLKALSLDGGLSPSRSRSP
jgi:hypothetical protein